MRTHRTLVSTGLAVAATSLAVMGLGSPAQAAEERSASGTPTFDCMLQPFMSAFPYTGPMTLTAKEADGAVKLAAVMSDIPGIAPVEIDGGKMRITLEGKIGSTPFTLTGKSDVNVGMKEDVAVPKLTGEITSAEGNIELSKFTFEFDKMMGLDITSGCDAGKDAGLGLLSAGAPDQEASDARTEAAGDGKAEVAKAEDESSAMPLMLGGGAAVLVVGGAVAWFFSRRKPA